MNQFKICGAGKVIAALKSMYFGFKRKTFGVGQITNVTEKGITLRLSSCMCPMHSGKKGEHKLFFRAMVMELTFDGGSTPSISISFNMKEADRATEKFFVTYGDDEEDGCCFLCGYLFENEADAIRFFT
ncbi:MAG: hypothetical protein HYW15_01915 [Candidatus Giovannonibacteria bacterium]|nr:MAG: hypothetical protein HYW15_01915 [Candidatus Giovannonibacteria bacterium]